MKTMSGSHSGGGGPSKVASSSAVPAVSATAASAATTLTGDKGLVGVRNGDLSVLPSAAVPYFGADSVKMIAESIGIGNVADDAARAVADDITKKLKTIIADAAKFTHHGRRTLLNYRDIEYALKIKNIPPMLGFCDPELLPFRYASGGGRELFFQEEKEVELSDIVNSSALAKIPQEVALKNHWLSIDGIQPAIPDNPPPLSKDRQRIESIDPSQVLRNNGNTFSNAAQNRFISQKRKKLVEVIKVKQYATHELSVEQQLYYKEITEACVGSDETRRSEALHSLMFDSGLHQMLPRLCTFISEGVKVNVVQNNLALLIYLMRMVKALLDNPNLYLEKYLHELIPTVITCIVSKQLCLRPEQDNHWALRDFGSRLLSQICRNFNTNTNNIQVRVTQLLASALDKERPILPSMYGAISCLCEMGLEVQRTFLLKRLKSIGEKLRVGEQNANAQDKTSVEHIRMLISRSLPSTIKQTMKPPPETLEEFKAEFGSYLGPLLHQSSTSLRLTSSTSSTTSSSSSGAPKAISNMSPAVSTVQAAGIPTIRRLSDNRPVINTGQLRTVSLDQRFNVQQQQMESRQVSMSSSGNVNPLFRVNSREGSSSSPSTSIIRPQTFTIATSSPSVSLGQQPPSQSQLPPSTSSSLSFSSSNFDHPN